MGKNKIISLFMLVLIVIFGGCNVFATEYCKMTSVSQNSVVRIRTNVGGTENKYGYVYDFRMNNLNAFCLDINKSASSSITYRKGEKVDREKDKWLYQIYQVYYSHKDSNLASEYIFGAQVAFWVYENRTGIGCTVSSVSELEQCVNGKVEQNLYDAFLLAYLTRQCKAGNNENYIKKALNNDKFSCDAYMTPPAKDENGNRIITDDMKYCEIVRGAKKCEELPLTSLSTTDYSYLNLFRTTGDKSIYKYIENTSARDAAYKGTYVAAQHFADSQTDKYMKATEMYEGDLYYWYPPNTSYQQRFIGVGTCDNKVKNCNEELEDLLKTTPVAQRNHSNQKYMEEIEKLKQKYSGFDDTDIANPKCPPSCDSELAKLLKNTPVASRNAANATYIAALEVLKQKYPTFDYSNLQNPSCTYTPPPTCEPAFENYACSYQSDNTGFYMSDADNANPNESCYLTKGIAYETESNQKVYSKDEEFSTNPYCDVYCWEAFGAHFPNPLSNIKAGTTFYWGVLDRETGVFGNLNAKRICKTPGINYTQFSTDWSNNETEVLNAYNAYKAQEAYNNAEPTNTGEYCCAKTEMQATSGYDPGNYLTSANNYEGTTCDAHFGVGEHVPCSDPKNATATACCKKTTGETPVCVQDGKTWKKEKKSYGTGNNIKYSKETATTCVGDNVTDKEAAANTALNGDLNSLKQTLVAQIEDRKTISANIEACQSQNIINKDSMYTFNSTVTLNYSDPAGVNRGISSSVEMIRDTARDFTGVVDTPGATDGTYTYTCTTTTGFSDSSNKCGTTITKYKTYTWEFQGVWYFKYNQDDYYWQSIVENAHVVNNKTYTADYSGMKIVPYTIGYGIPTAFSLKTGFYEISVDVKGFGNNGTHFEPLVKEELGSEILNYACPFHVVNELYGKECNFECNFATRTCTLTADSPAYCDNEVKGIDLVYRVIEMASGDTKTIFPSIDGDGRNPGTNWATYIADKNKAYKNITTPSVIYDDEPIYEIDLTPTLINQIRRDNLTYREQNMDPYTSYTDANNQEKVICEGVDTNRTCASHYITTLIDQNVLNGEYADCHNCGSTAERLKYIDSMKERYNN